MGVVEHAANPVHAAGDQLLRQRVGVESSNRRGVTTSPSRCFHAENPVMPARWRIESAYRAMSHLLIRSLSWRMAAPVISR